MKRLVGMALCNIVQLAGLILTTVLPITSFSSRPGAAGAFAVSLVPLSLVLNETKWMTRALWGGPSDVPILRERGGLTFFVLLFLLCASVSVIVLCMHIHDEMTQPLYTQASDGKYGYVSYLAIVTLIAGLPASLLLL